jgi:hypothetical protein
VRAGRVANNTADLSG